MKNEFGVASVKPCNGSYSFICKSDGSPKRIAKLIPKYEYGEVIILVGFSDAFENAQSFAGKVNSFVEQVNFGVRPEPFTVAKMKNPEDVDTTTATLIDFIKSNMD